MLTAMKKLLVTLTAAGGLTWFGEDPVPAASADWAVADPSLAQYFQSETRRVAEGCLARIQTLADWKAQRQEYRRQLQEMLGLWPLPERTDLKPVIAGQLDHPEFTVQKLHFQASPGLYVTANLYLPKHLEKPAPAILYACGHSRAVTNGIVCGNKTGYQHHGAWFARHGYVCLLIDTVELGEIPGVHRGTHSEKQWWWNSRGYTPAGVEAWFGIRALDYLCTRPEVDRERIGMTGRSGGGSYTWTVAALDDRVKVAVPVAGITDLRNHIVDGAVEGHCDCMFFVNTYRWDFAQVAALLAPRPLLFSNSDKDSIFPLDGVLRIHEQVRRIYRLYQAHTNLGLLITEGPHADTQDLQVPAFRWFNRWLKNDASPIERAAVRFFAPTDLRAFDTLPADAINPRIAETFVPRAASNPLPQPELISALRQKVFRGWPGEPAPVQPRLSAQAKDGALRYHAYEFNSQEHVSLGLHVVQHAKVRKPKQVILSLVDTAHWDQAPLAAVRRGDWRADSVAALLEQLQQEQAAIAFFAPRLVKPEELAKLPEKKAAQIRRRFVLLGQTLDGMRVWDIRCAVQALRSLPDFKRAPLAVRASGEMGVNAAYAALFEPDIARLELTALPPSHMQGPDYLNVLKITDIPQVLECLRDRLEPAADPRQRSAEP
jgi:hypothetical protein